MELINFVQTLLRPEQISPFIRKIFEIETKESRFLPHFVSKFSFPRLVLLTKVNQALDALLKDGVIPANQKLELFKKINNWFVQSRQLLYYGIPLITSNHQVMLVLQKAIRNAIPVVDHDPSNELGFVSENGFITKLGLSCLRLRSDATQDFWDNLANLEHLAYLELSDNDLRALPPALQKLKKLHKIILYGNPLEQLSLEMRSWLASFQHRGGIIFGCNPPLFDIEIQDSDLDALKILDNIFLRKLPVEERLWENRIEVEHRKITKLDLSGMHLGHFDEKIVTTLERFESLNNLDISRNSLKNLPDTITKLAFLQRLDISYNKFSTLPEEITHLKNLQYFNAESNPRLIPEREIREWLRQLKARGSEIPNYDPKWDISDSEYSALLEIEEMIGSPIPSKPSLLTEDFGVVVAGNHVIAMDLHDQAIMPKSLPDFLRLKQKFSSLSTFRPPQGASRVAEFYSGNQTRFKRLGDIAKIVNNTTLSPLVLPNWAFRIKEIIKDDIVIRYRTGQTFKMPAQDFLPCFTTLRKSDKILDPSPSGFAVKEPSNHVLLDFDYQFRAPLDKFMAQSRRKTRWALDSMLDVMRGQIIIQRAPPYHVIFTATPQLASSKFWILEGPVQSTAQLLVSWLDSAWGKMQFYSNEPLKEILIPDLHSMGDSAKNECISALQGLTLHTRDRRRLDECWAKALREQFCFKDVDLVLRDINSLLDQKVKPRRR